MGTWVEIANHEEHTCLFCRYASKQWQQKFTKLRVFFWTKPQARKYAIIGICPSCGDIRKIGDYPIDPRYTQELVDAMV